MSAKNKWGKIHTGIGTRARILFFFIDQKGRERKKIRRNLITNRERKRNKKDKTSKKAQSKGNV